MKCAVFASGGGSNFQALLDKRKSNDLHVDFVLCVGNNSTAKAFERAKKNNIPTLHISPAHFETEEEYTKTLLSKLNDLDVELIILAGYMKMIPAEVVKQYKNRIINIHPGLLPAFGGKGMHGANVHKAVLDYGAKITGVTVHFVDEQYDHGAIISQTPVIVKDNDTVEILAARVLKTEHDVFWKAIEEIAQKKLLIKGRTVVRKN